MNLRERLKGLLGGRAARLVLFALLAMGGATVVERRMPHVVTFRLLLPPGEGMADVQLRDASGARLLHSRSTLEALRRRPSLAVRVPLGELVWEARFGESEALHRVLVEISPGETEREVDLGG